jgi:hypothetical protein
MSSKNLWGDLPVIEDDVDTPLMMMREQANFLKQSSRGLLHASISTTPLALGKMRHRFYLVAPLLNDYRHLLFSVEHGIDSYPARVESRFFGTGGKPSCKDANAFENLLRLILTHAETRKAIASLVANSKALKSSEG